MKKSMLLLCGVALMFVCGVAIACAQHNKVGRGPDPATIRDPELERDSLKNLEVARHYFKVKKAYRASLARCEEIIAGDPNFSKIDEALYIAGVSNLRLSENKGKQTPTMPVEKHRDDAREYLSRIVNEYPDSPFRKKAEEELSAIGGVKPKDKQ